MSRPGAPDNDRILIRGGRIIDPASGFDQTADLLVSDGAVVQIGKISDREAANGADAKDLQVIDAEGCMVAPGLIDIHVHFREPGGEYKETIATGVASALNGGFTTVCCMPNTRPPLDSPAMVGFVDRQAKACAGARVFTIAAATVERKGERPGALWALAQAGAVGFSDDGDCIMNARVMRDVLSAARETGLPMMQHCQDRSLTQGAAMNAGPLATRLGLGGWPSVAEEIIIARDIMLNQDVGAKYHVQHVSAAGSVDLVRRAQRDGQTVTAEASPHHLLLTEDACDGYNTQAKMNPPLRTRADIAALKEGIADGTITVLATDHAPHSDDEKAQDFASAPFGIIGLDCALSLYAKALIEGGVLDWPGMLRMMTINSARLVGLDSRGLGSLSLGGPADVTIIDPDLEWTIDVAEFASRSRNCPFHGWKVRGRAVGTIVGGAVRLLRTVHRMASSRSSDEQRTKATGLTSRARQ
jgi:dihydroorotase